MAIEPTYKDLKQKILELEERLQGFVRVIVRTRKLSEERLEGVALLNAIIESTSDGCLVVDNKGAVVLSNAQFAKMWRIPLDLIDQKDDMKLLNYVLVQLVEPDAFLSRVERLSQTVEEDIDELRFKDGRFFERYSRPLIQDEEMLGRIWSFRDITERKNAERAIQDAHEYAANIVSSIREPLLVLNAGLKVVSANRSFFKTFKVTPEETDGQLIYNLGGRQWDIPRLRDLLEEILSTNATFDDFEVEHEFPVIGRRIMLLNARKIYRAANKTELILLAIEDITARKQAEEELIRVQKEAELYLDLMSHDLSNFNQTIALSLQLLEKRLEPDEKQKKYLDSCARQLAKSENLISKVRAFSSVKQIEKQALKAIDLNKSIADALKIVKKLHPKKTLDVEFEPSGDKIAAGTELIDSVFMNVLENTAKHSSKDQVWLAISVDDAERDPQKLWEVRIADDGPGVPDKLKENIFDRYSKIGKEKGMGLGLSLAKAIVEKYGGTIWVEDRLEGDHSKGSVFRMLIPKK